MRGEGHPLPRDIFREHLELRGSQDILPEHLSIHGARYNMNIPSVKNPRACAPFVFFFFFFFPPRSVHRTFHFASLENTNPCIHLINSTQCNQSINQSIEYMYQTPRSKTSSEREKRGRKRKIHSNTAFPNQPARQPLTYHPLKLHLTSPDSR